MLTEANKSFNRIFGWTLLFTIGKEVAQLLECLNYRSSITKISFIDKTFERDLKIESAIQLVYTTVRISI